MTTVWVSQAHSSQRAVVEGVRAALPDAEVVASHALDREDILSAASRSVREPALPPAERAAWLLARAREAGASLLVAGRGRRELCALRPAFAGAGIRLACGATDPAALELADRKDRFAAALSQAGLPVPLTYRVDTPDDLYAAVARLKAAGARPCVKPATGIYGSGFWILQDGADPLGSLLDRHLSGAERLLDPSALAAALSGTARPEPLVAMEFLPGTERSVDCVCDDGRLVASASRAKLGSHQVVEPGGPATELAARVVALLRLDGLVNVQTRDGADGLPRVLEVNTRPSGGVGYAFAAGINLPGALALHLLGRPLPVPPAEPVAVRVNDVAIRLEALTAAMRQPPVAA